MRVKDLYSLVIKIFGFLIIKDIFTMIPSLFYNFLYFANDQTGNLGFWPIIIPLLIKGIYFAFAYILIFKTESIVKILNLTPDFLDDKLNIEISSLNVLNIALVFTCGYILIEEFTNLAKQCYLYFEQTQYMESLSSNYITTFITIVVKIVIAFLIIGERKQIIKFILTGGKRDPIE